MLIFEKPKTNTIDTLSEKFIESLENYEYLEEIFKGDSSSEQPEEKS